VCVPVALLWRAVGASNGLDAGGVRDRADAAEKWFEENDPDMRFWNKRRLRLPVPRSNDGQRREPPFRLGCRDGDRAAFNHIEFHAREVTAAKAAR
jgi:hypothetical protein